MFASVSLTCASGETTPEDQTREQPDVQAKEQVKTDNLSEEQQASLNLICDSAEVSKKQLVKEVETGFSAKAKHEA